METTRQKYKEQQRQIRIDNIPEIWKDITWYEWLYKVSNIWRVKSLKYNKEKILKNQLWKRWYYTVVLSNLTKCRHFIHRLIAQEFIFNKDNKYYINHINWNKLDNSINNLEWCTSWENNLHSYRILWKKYKTPNKWKFWVKNHLSKKVNQYDLDWNFIKIWDSIMDVQRVLWIHNSQVSACCKNKEHYKSAWWFIWKYN